MKNEVQKKARKWTKAEVRFLKKYWSTSSDKAIAKALERTIPSVRCKASTVGIKKAPTFRGAKVTICTPKDTTGTPNEIKNKNPKVINLNNEKTADKSKTLIQDLRNVTSISKPEKVKIRISLEKSLMFLLALGVINTITLILVSLIK